MATGLLPEKYVSSVMCWKIYDRLRVYHALHITACLLCLPPLSQLFSFGSIPLCDYPFNLSYICFRSILKSHFFLVFFFIFRILSICFMFALRSLLLLFSIFNIWFASFNNFSISRFLLKLFLIFDLITICPKSVTI